MSNSTTPSMGASTGAQQFPSADIYFRMGSRFVREQCSVLKSTTFHVYTCLLSRLGAMEYVKVAHRTLASDAGVSYSTAKRALAELKKAGLVFWEHEQRSDNGYGANKYFFRQLEKARPTFERYPPLNLSDKEIKEVSPLSDTPPTTTEPLVAAEVAALQKHGVYPAILGRFIRTRPAACRHALAVIQGKAKWFAKCKKPGAVVKDMIEHPELYALEPEPKAPRISAEARQFIDSFCEERREALAGWLGTPDFEAMLSCWRAMSPEKRARLVTESECLMMAFWPLMQEIATAG